MQPCPLSPRKHNMHIRLVQPCKYSKTIVQVPQICIHPAMVLQDLPNNCSSQVTPAGMPKVELWWWLRLHNIIQGLSLSLPCFFCHTLWKAFYLNITLTNTACKNLDNALFVTRNEVNLTTWYSNFAYISMGSTYPVVPEEVNTLKGICIGGYLTWTKEAFTPLCCSSYNAQTHGRKA